jgi:hypothetical protein
MSACASPAGSLAPSALPTRAPEASVAPATPASTPGASAAASAPTPSAPVVEAWRLVELPGAGGATGISDVVARPRGVTAASVAGPAGKPGTAWTSLDRGVTWTAEPIPGSARSLDRLVPWGARLLAVGEGDGDCAHPSVVDVWVRSAAGTWRAAPFDPLLCAGGTARAAASGPRAVIVGTGSGDVAYAWSSDDGLRWADHSGMFVDRLPQGVAADGSGFVAVGSGVGGASAWVTRSPDGETWRAPQALPGPAGMTVIGGPVEVDGEPAIFVADPAGAVGILRPNGTGGWRSKPCDGLTSTSVTRILATAGGLLALGADGRRPAVWASADGGSWRALDLPPEVVASGATATLTGAAVADGRAYLVGQLAAPGGAETAALWTGPASLLAP